MMPQDIALCVVALGWYALTIPALHFAHVLRASRCRGCPDCARAREVAA